MIEDEGWFYLEPADLLVEVDRFRLGPVRSQGGLEACCARPRQSVGGDSIYPDVATKAAAIAAAISRSHHPLVDGNKRLGAIAALHFCHVNGFELACTVAELVAVFVGLAEGELGEREAGEFFGLRMTALPRTRDGES